MYGHGTSNSDAMKAVGGGEAEGAAAADRSRDDAEDDGLHQADRNNEKVTKMFEEVKAGGKLRT